MKKYLFGFAAVVALGFSACTPDEPANDQPTVSPIVAKWEVTNVYNSCSRQYDRWYVIGYYDYSRVRG